MRSRPRILLTIVLTLSTVGLLGTPGALAERQSISVEGQAGPDGATVTVSAEGDLVNEEETVAVPPGNGIPPPPAPGGVLNTVEQTFQSVCQPAEDTLNGLGPLVFDNCRQVQF